MPWIFTFPIDRNHPPAGAIVEQLNAVDAPSKWLLAPGVPRFIGAPHVRDVVPDLGPVGDRSFVEAFFVKEGFCPLRILIYRQVVGADLTAFIAVAGYQPGARIEERTEAVPIAWSGRAGDGVVKRGNSVLHAVHIGGICRRCCRRLRWVGLRLQTKERYPQQDQQKNTCTTLECVFHGCPM